MDLCVPIILLKELTDKAYYLPSISVREFFEDISKQVVETYPVIYRYKHTDTEH